MSDVTQGTEEAQLVAATEGDLLDLMARAWDEGRATSDCRCGHNVYAHPSEKYRHCLAKGCGCERFTPPENPYMREGLS